MAADWKALARKLDWAPTYVNEEELFQLIQYIKSLERRQQHGAS